MGCPFCGLETQCTCLEQKGALQDVLEVACQYGSRLYVYIRDEKNVTRDTYDTIKSKQTQPDLNPYIIPAYPVIMQPNQKQLEKAGIRETCDVIAYTPMQAWTQSGVTFQDIDLIRSTVVLQSDKYEIKEKKRDSQFINTFLYIVLGLNLR
jgi:hypothetical protein